MTFPKKTGPDGECRLCLPVATHQQAPYMGAGAVHSMPGHAGPPAENPAKQSDNQPGKRQLAAAFVSTSHKCDKACRPIRRIPSYPLS
jgi:hypothetical protein